MKQAVDYAANQGVEWVVLTNGLQWVMYHVLFKKPIDKQEICTLDLQAVNVRNESDLCKMFLFTKEGMVKNALAEYRDRQDATSRFMLAAIVLNSEGVLSAIRKEIRRTSEISVDIEEIQKMFREQVLKREAIEGEQAETAVRRFNRSASARGKIDTAATRPASPTGVVPSTTPATS